MSSDKAIGVSINNSSKIYTPYFGRFYWTISAILFIVAYNSQIEWEVFHVFLAGAIIFTGAVFFAADRNPNEFNIFAMLMTWIHVIYYCYQSFLPLARYEAVTISLVVEGTEHSRLIASFCVLIGIVGLVIGMSANHLNHKVQIYLVNYHRESSRAKLVFWCITIYLLNLVFLGLEVGIELGFLIVMLKTAQYFIISILFINYLKGQLSRKVVFLFFLIVASNIAISVSSGFVAQIIQLFMMLFFLYLVVRKKMPGILLLLIGATIVITLLMFKSTFRAIYWDSGDTLQASEVFYRLIGFYEVITKTIEIDQLVDLLNSVALRLGMFHVFEYVASLTPQFIPYWGGDGYYPLLFKFFPRFIFESKSLEDMGQFFGHLYTFLDPSDDGTSINLPVLIEFYLNFGVISVAVGMLSIGLFYVLIFRFIDRLFLRADTALAAKAIFFMNFSIIESNLSLVYGGVPLALLIMLILDRLLNSKIY